MSGPIRVLHVLGTLNMGGAESRIMDLYRHIDREKVQFDFLVHYKETEEDLKNHVGTDSDSLYQRRPKDAYDEEALSYGARIYVLPRFTGKNLGTYKKACRNFFAFHHDFAVVEGHMTSMASIYLPIAKEEGVSVTIAHARSAGVEGGIRGAATKWFRRSLPEKCDIMMSCSRSASRSVFGKKAAESGKIILVPNALDLFSFSFDPLKRQSVRQEYSIKDNVFVIGHVGRFDPVKNQVFLSRVGARLSQREEKFCFLFVGEGKEQNAVRSAFEEAGLLDHVIFAGAQPREKTQALYQAFDAFILPSLYEGLPGTVIEAQSAGLPCLIADTITDEVVLTNLVKQFSLDEEDSWAKELEEDIQEEKMMKEAPLLQKEGEEERALRSRQAIQDLTDQGYEINSFSRSMEQLYVKLAKGEQQ